MKNERLYGSWESSSEHYAFVNAVRGVLGKAKMIRDGRNRRRGQRRDRQSDGVPVHRLPDAADIRGALR